MRTAPRSYPVGRYQGDQLAAPDELVPSLPSAHQPLTNPTLPIRCPLQQTPCNREPGVASGIMSGMLGGMRRKTSLTLDEDSIPLARSCAEAEGLDVGRWLDRAIRHEAARVDVDVIAEWEASLPPDDQAVLAALDSADRHDFDAA